MVGSAIAQPIHPYRTGPSIALASSLQRNCQSSNQKLPLLDQLSQWKIGYAIPVWLDRRIPNDLEISIDENWTTVGDSIAGVAEQIDADIAFIDGVIMFVPKGRATHLENTYWSLSIGVIPKVWLRVEDTVLSWEEGAVSTEVLKAFCSKFPLLDFQPDQIEHDVWGAARLDKTTPLVVAIGLLSSFDLQPVLRSEGIAVSPIPMETTPALLTWEYQNEIAKLGKERWQQWRSRWSDAEVRRIGEESNPSWLIKAPVAAHRELVRPLAPPPKSPSPSDRSNVRYTGRYRGELQAILRSLAKQRELQLELPDLPQTMLRQELDLVFEQSTFEEIMAKISSASGLHLRLDGNQLRVSTPRD